MKLFPFGPRHIDDDGASQITFADDLQTSLFSHSEDRMLGGTISRPGEELKGFQHVTLKPNETKTVQLSLKASTLDFWDEKQARFQLEAEPVKLMIGNSSKDIKLATTVRVQ